MSNECNGHKVPRSIMNASGNEIQEPEELNVIDGYDLPDDLHGHVFIVAPIGNVSNDNQGKQPYMYIVEKNQTDENGGPFINGDGMIYRFDFNDTSKVKWMQKIVKPKDYKVAENIKNSQEELNFPELFKFSNYGLLNFSLLLGMRNQLNTAFLPIPFKDDDNRMLVTYDGGRPYEIDTKTLEVVTPVGALAEWKPLIDRVPIFPLKPILSTAHPVFDTKKGDGNREMFTVNYGRSVLNFLDILEKIDIPKILQQVESVLPLPSRYSGDLINNAKDRVKAFLDRAKALKNILRVVTELLQKILPKIPWLLTDFVYLMKWDGENCLKRWSLVDCDGSPIKLYQSIHQMALTEDYVVLMDTSYSFGVAQGISNFRSISPLRRSASILREWTRSIPEADTLVYIVNREDLKQERNTVVARKVRIPGEVIHFTVDYENPEQKIVLHVAHLCAWDVAEWLRKDDTSPYGGFDIPSDILGMLVGVADASLMGRYVIDASHCNKPEIIESKTMKHDRCTWGPTLSTYDGEFSNENRLGKIYWTSLGLWQELTTKFMCDQYKDYKYRNIPLKELLKKAKEGRPSCLFKLDAQSLKIEDHYEFPKGHIAFSPAFVPKKDRDDKSQECYIVCVVFTPLRSEIWIFDTENLNKANERKEKGPVCKLYHDNLNIGMSIHATWLKNIGPRQYTEYDIKAEDDYKKSIKELKDFVEGLQYFCDKEKDDLLEDINKAFS